MDKTQAISDITTIFSQYKSLLPADHALLASLGDGKLYELYVLSELLQDLRNRFFTLSFQGNTLKFKASPGKIKLTDPHFTVQSPTGPQFWIFVDIEFLTLGTTHAPVSDLSRHHELDIVIVDATPPNPTHDQIALAIECKCVAKFSKKLIKEALGVRRELVLLTNAQFSTLTQASQFPPVSVPADPPSEFWLAFIDPAGTNYADSPAAFGIQLRHIQP